MTDEGGRMRGAGRPGRDKVVNIKQEAENLNLHMYEHGQSRRGLHEDSAGPLSQSGASGQLEWLQLDVLIGLRLHHDPA